MKLTKYGKKVLSRTFAVAALLVMVTGAAMMLTDRLTWFLGGSKMLNVLYVAVVMPVCFTIMVNVAFMEYDKYQNRL